MANFTKKETAEIQRFQREIKKLGGLPKSTKVLMKAMRPFLLLNPELQKKVRLAKEAERRWKLKKVM